MNAEPGDVSLNRGGSSRRNSRRPLAKIPLACQPCRNRKSRCDGIRPMCTRCRQRGLSPDDCMYRDEPVSAAQMMSIKTLQNRVHELEGIIRNVQNAHEPPSSAVPPTGHHAASAYSPEATSSFVDSQHRRNDANRHSSSNAANAATRLSDHRPPSPAGHGGDSPRIHHRRQPLPSSSKQPRREEADVTAMGTVVSEDGLTDRLSTEHHNFYGTSSAAAFIREACKSLRRSGAAEQLRTSSAGGGAQLATPVSQQMPTPALSQTAYSLTLPPRSLADHLISSFFRRVYHLYPFFDRPTFEAAYRKLWEAKSTSPPVETGAANPLDVGLGNELNCSEDSMVFHCALNAIFALACHFSDIPSADRESTADMFFQKTKSFISIGLLEHNSLSVVQTLLIVALYLQSTAFPDRCWNSVGIACRLAQGLGLHIGSKGGSLEAQVRQRTWYCCVILDMNVSMTFGRPPMTSTIPELRGATSSCLGFHEEDALGRPAEDDEECFFIETYRLSQILEGILRTIYQPWRDKNERDSRCGSGRRGESHYGKLDSTVELDMHLSRFERSLPQFLSWIRESDISTSLHARDDFALQKNVLHGRFLYVRLMLYRPLLSQFWSTVHQEATQSSRASSPIPRGSLIRSSFALECCKHCVNYSTDLISLTYQSFLTQHTTAWWWNALYSFTCGFVFILAISCPPVRTLLVVDAVEQSWQQCQTILESISTTSLSVQRSLHLLRQLYQVMVTNTHNTTAVEVDHCEPTSYHQDATQEPNDISISTDGFANMEDIFAKTIDTDMIETLFNSLGSGIAFGDDIIS